jgi:AmiR/NasT family two-component response regulator
MNALIANPVFPFPTPHHEIIPQTYRRRASDTPNRIEGRMLVADPLLPPQPVLRQRRITDTPSAPCRPLPAPSGSLLIVHDTTEGWRDPGIVWRLLGLQILQVKNQKEAVQILMEKEFRIDLLLVVHHSSPSSSAADLILKSLDIRPGLHTVMMVDSGRREDIRAGYDAGATSIILNDISEERLFIFLKQSLSSAREDQRQELQRRARRERHASDTPARRGIRRIKFWVDAPSGSRRKAGLGAAITVATALLIGMGFAHALEQSYRNTDRYEAMANRMLEGMIPSRGSSHNVDGAVQRWQAAQQIGLTRDANEATRRYYQDHLQELRWQNYSRSSSASEPVASPPPPSHDGLSEMIHRYTSDENTSGQAGRRSGGTSR